MFKISRTQITMAFTLLALVVSTSATPYPTAIDPRGADASVNVEVCTGTVGHGCVAVPVGSDGCVNLNGGLVFLNKEISSAVVPDGFVCTFFEDFGCLSEQSGADVVVLQGGTWNFSAVSGVAGTVNFIDKTSSFSCSPV